MKQFFFALIFLTSSMSFATSDENLKRRLDGYVKAMMEGEKSPILPVQDYFSLVYFADKAKIESLKKNKDGSVEAQISFQTEGSVQQDAEGTPFKITKVNKKEEIRATVIFKEGPTSLKFQKKLDVPFVKTGKASRYLLEPDKK